MKKLKLSVKAGQFEMASWMSGAETIASAKKTLFSYCMIGGHGGVENGSFKANDSLKNWSICPDRFWRLRKRIEDVCDRLTQGIHGVGELQYFSFPF